MEDLIGLIAFVVIAAINLLAQSAKKKKAKERLEGAEPQPEKKPSPFESFFEDLVEKVDPPPDALPEWAQNLERPDYVQEMEAFEQVEEEKPPVVVERFPEPEQEPFEIPAVQGVEKTVVFQAPPRVASSVFAGTSNIRMPSIPLMKSNPNGSIDFNLTDRKILKQAIIANIIFSQPRAYDCSFDNTIAK